MTAGRLSSTMMTENTAEDAEVLSRIRSFIAQTFPLARRRNITDDGNLLSSGVMDSLGCWRS